MIVSLIGSHWVMWSIAEAVPFSAAVTYHRYHMKTHSTVHKRCIITHASLQLVTEGIADWSDVAGIHANKCSVSLRCHKAYERNYTRRSLDNIHLTYPPMVFSYYYYTLCYVALVIIAVLNLHFGDSQSI